MRCGLVAPWLQLHCGFVPAPCCEPSFSVPFIRVRGTQFQTKSTNCPNDLIRCRRRRRRISCKSQSQSQDESISRLVITSFLMATAAVVIAASVATADAICEPETLANIPQTLSAGDCKKSNKIQKPNSRKAESCTVKCVNTCIRGGQGEGPLNVRRPLVVFKQGFRSRQYW